MAAELQELCQIFGGSGARVSLGMDTGIWRGESLGEFSVASADNLLNNGGTRSLGTYVIWTIPAPSKVKGFLWLVANDAILTRENLIRCNCPIDATCIRCQGEIESTKHLSLLCPFNQHIWGVILDAFERTPLTKLEWLLGRLEYTIYHKEIS